MTRIGVISNPNSQRNRQDSLDGINAVLDDHPNVLHRKLRDFSELGDIVASFERAAVEVIVVNGGDGTVQAMLTELARRNDRNEAPKLAILPGGMTNVIARDVGLDGPPPKALARLIERLAADEGIEAPTIDQVTRPLIGLATGAGKPPIYGMFFGAAGFYRAVMLAQEKVRPKGVAGSLASAASLAHVLFRLLLGRTDGDDRLYQGEVMTIDLDGDRGRAQPYLLLIATTLDRLILGLMPFWGTPGNALRYTSVAFPPRRLARALLPVLRGKPRPWMTDQGYRSGTVDDLIIDTKSPVVLDGEIYHPEPGCPIRLSGDRFQTFVRC